MKSKSVDDAVSALGMLKGVKPLFYVGIEVGEIKGTDVEQLQQELLFQGKALSELTTCLGEQVLPWVSEQMDEFPAVAIKAYIDWHISWFPYFIKENRESLSDSQNAVLSDFHPDKRPEGYPEDQSELPFVIHFFVMEGLVGMIVESIVDKG